MLLYLALKATKATVLNNLLNGNPEFREVDESSLTGFMIRNAEYELVCFGIVLQHENDLSVLRFLAKQHNNY